MDRIIKKEILSLRNAEPGDIDILFQWANDSETRRNSFDQHEIAWDEHEAWFNRMINDPDRVQFIMMNDNTPVGQIRLDISGDVAIISYSIAPEERGKGYGKRIIKLAKEMIHKDYPSIIRMKAEVKPQKKASIKGFEQKGFAENNRVYETDLVDITHGGGADRELILFAGSYFEVLAA